MPSFEIVDSRIRDWQIRLCDTVADNGSAGLFVMGETGVDPRSVDLAACRMTLQENDEIVSEGTGADALGSPLNCVAWLANEIGELNAGDVILSGSLGPVVPANPGSRLEVKVSGIGVATLQFI